MLRFATARDAKEYLIGLIVAQASRDGVSLTDIERKMLYFSETHRTLPDIRQVNSEFEKNYDEDEYERKIAGLVHHIRENISERESWNEAVSSLSSEDHYLLVLINGDTQFRPSRPAGDKPRLVLTACAIIVVLFAAISIIDSHVSDEQLSKLLSGVLVLILAAGGMYISRRISR